MEMYTYKCPECHFIHCVPAYWSSYKPEPEIEMLHINLGTKEPCSNEKLVLVEE